MRALACVFGVNRYRGIHLLVQCRNGLKLLNIKALSFIGIAKLDRYKEIIREESA